MPHHLLFEGAELAGKSWIMSQVYAHLEKKYNQSREILDGCHWFNADIGVFGTALGKNVIKGYLPIFQTLKSKNIIVEKLHISDAIYNKIHRQKNLNYKKIEQELLDMDFKIIFIKFKPNKELLKKRLCDRFNLYPHYRTIAKSPQWYISQQEQYEKQIKKSILPSLTLETEILPDKKHLLNILDWIKE
jgi:hypothetical protein